MSATWNRLYGNPGTKSRPDPKWQERHLRTMKLPYPMRLAWNTAQTVTTTRVHYRVQPYLEAALADLYAHVRTEIKAEVGYNKTTAEYDRLTLARLGVLGLDLFGGVYNHRVMRGGNNLSAHSYAIAIDLDPKHNALGTTGRIAKSQMWVVDIFKRRGFTWGGNWRRKDGQHLEFAGFPQ